MTASYLDASVKRAGAVDSETPESRPLTEPPSPPGRILITRFPQEACNENRTEQGRVVERLDEP